MIDTLLRAVQALGVLGFVVSLTLLRRPALSERTPITASVSIAVALLAALLLLPVTPWIALGGAVLAGVAFAVIINKAADLRSVAFVYLALLSLVALAATVTTVHLLQGVPSHGANQGALYHFVAGLVLIVCALATGVGATRWASLGYSTPRHLPGRRVWWLIAAVSVVGVAVALLVVAGGGVAAATVAVVAAAIVGFVVALLFPVPLPQLIPLLVGVVGAAVVALGVLSSSVIVVVIAGVSTGMGVAACAVPRNAAHTPSSQVTLQPYDAAVLVGTARRIVVLPGRQAATPAGMQAVRNLVAVAQARGGTVSVAAHPLAGGLPGHMTSLLLAAGFGVDDVLVDKAAITNALAQADVALVVGAGADDGALWPDLAGVDISAARMVVSVPAQTVEGPQSAAQSSSLTTHEEASGYRRVIDVSDIATGRAVCVVKGGFSTVLPQISEHLES